MRLSLYFQLRPSGTFADAVRFADLMAGTDSPTGQDLQAIHYYTDRTGPHQEQFSRRNTITEDTNDPNRVVIA